MVDIKERIKEALDLRGMMPIDLSRASGINKGSSPVCSTNRPLDFIAFQAVLIFLRANFGQKKNPTAYAMG